jgi:acyl carrier protein
VAEHLELAPDELTDTSLLLEDHGADSLSRIDILAALEKEFRVTIDQSELERMVNIESVYAVVTEAAARQRPPATRPPLRPSRRLVWLYVGW